MPADAFALALAAAVVHAGWNVVLAGARDVPSVTAAALLVGTAVFLVPAVSTWRLSAAAVPYLVAATVAQTVYIALLAAAYARADMSVVYPVARGSAPVLVAVVALPSAVQAVGVVVIGAGVMAVRGLREPPKARDLRLALAVGACIATYTLLDKQAVRHAAPLAYLEVELGASALLYAGWLRRRGVRLELGWRAGAAGVGTFGAYGLTLTALRLAPAAAVAAVRETSVVFGVAIAAVVLGEKVTRARLTGACVVAIGVALVAVG